MEWHTKAGGWRQRHVIQDAKLTVETTQDPAERQLILERNEALRNERPQRDLSFGRQVASIPVQDYCEALQLFPDLRATDKQAREIAWAAFLARPESKKYLVQ